MQLFTISEAGVAHENLIHPDLWAIRHKPTGQLLRQRKCGYGHTQLDVEPRKDIKTVYAPRIFTSEDTAKRALIQWLQGIHRNYWEDGLSINKPATPRVKEDMEVVRVYLYTDAPDPDKEI